MDRMIFWIERIAACFLGVVVVLTVTTVALRDIFSVQIPDWYQFACIAQAVAIFWGLAPATYANNHIMVDLLWEALGPRGRRNLDILAGSISLALLAVLAFMLLRKVLTTADMNDVTTDLRLQLWPFYLLAALGIAAAVLLGSIRMARLIAGRNLAEIRPQQLD